MQFHDEKGFLSRNIDQVGGFLLKKVCLTCFVGLVSSFKLNNKGDWCVVLRKTVLVWFFYYVV